jgi:hypothetical protein
MGLGIGDWALGKAGAPSGDKGQGGPHGGASTAGGLARPR